MPRLTWKPSLISLAARLAMWCLCAWDLAFSGDKAGSEEDVEMMGARVVNSMFLGDVARTMRST